MRRFFRVFGRQQVSDGRQAAATRGAGSTRGADLLRGVGARLYGFEDPTVANSVAVTNQHEMASLTNSVAS